MNPHAENIVLDSVALAALRCATAIGSVTITNSSITVGPYQATLEKPCESPTGHTCRTCFHDMLHALLDQNPELMTKLQEIGSQTEGVPGIVAGETMEALHTALESENPDPEEIGRVFSQAAQQAMAADHPPRPGVVVVTGDTPALNRAMRASGLDPKDPNGVAEFAKLAFYEAVARKGQTEAQG